MKTGEGCQESFNLGLEEANVWWNKHVAGCSRCSSRYRPVKKTTETVKSTVSSDNKRKYLKLYNGDIYCVQSNTILNRHTLRELSENMD